MSLTPSQFFDSIVTGVKDSVLQTVIPPVINFLSYVEKNPTNYPGIALQAILLKDQIVAAVPNLAEKEAAAMSTSLITILSAELAKVANLPAPAAA